MAKATRYTASSESTTDAQSFSAGSSASRAASGQAGPNASAKNSSRQVPSSRSMTVRAGRGPARRSGREPVVADKEAGAVQVGDLGVARPHPRAQRREGLVRAVAVAEREVARADGVGKHGRVGRLKILEVAPQKIRLERPRVDLRLGVGLARRLPPAGLHVERTAPAPDGERLVRRAVGAHERGQLAARRAGLLGVDERQTDPRPRRATRAAGRARRRGRSRRGAAGRGRRPACPRAASPGPGPCRSARAAAAGGAAGNARRPAAGRAH